MTELQILSAVKNNGGNIAFTSLLNLSITDTHQDPIADTARIEQMIKDDLLSGSTTAYGSISITKEGRVFLQNACYLEDHEKDLAKKASNDISKQHRHDWKLALGGAIAAGIIGLAFELVEYFFLD